MTKLTAPNSRLTSAQAASLFVEHRDQIYAQIADSLPPIPRRLRRQLARATKGSFGK